MRSRAGEAGLASVAHSCERLTPAYFLYELFLKAMLLTLDKYHNFISCKMRTAPQIKFVEIFDAVKALKDKDVHDSSFSDSIQHLRHAIALHEDRRGWKPEYLLPDFNETGLDLLSAASSKLGSWVLALICAAQKKRMVSHFTLCSGSSLKANPRAW